MYIKNYGFVVKKAKKVVRFFWWALQISNFEVAKQSVNLSINLSICQSKISKPSVKNLKFPYVWQNPDFTILIKKLFVGRPLDRFFKFLHLWIQNWILHNFAAEVSQNKKLHRWDFSKNVKNLIFFGVPTKMYTSPLILHFFKKIKRWLVRGITDEHFAVKIIFLALIVAEKMRVRFVIKSDKKW